MYEIESKLDKHKHLSQRKVSLPFGSTYMKIYIFLSFYNHGTLELKNKHDNQKPIENFKKEADFKTKPMVYRISMA